MIEANLNKRSRGITLISDYLVMRDLIGLKNKKDAALQLLKRIYCR